MSNKGKIQKVIWKGSFAEAEQKDNEYWARQTPEERLATLIDLRATFFSDAASKIEKIVYKRNINEQEIKAKA